MQAAKDEQIVARAVEEDRIVVSADSDFGAIIAAQEAEHPSFILFREPDLMVARDYFDALLPALPVLMSELASGCVAVFREFPAAMRNQHTPHLIARMVEEQAMEWIPVKSKMLAAVAYNRDWHLLYVDFRSGEVYCYRGVPVQLFEELLVADSKGQYCRSHVFPPFPYDRIPRTLRTAS